MHVIKKPSFVLCSFQIIAPAFAVSLNAPDFTVCYDLTKVHSNSADCLSTQMFLLSRIKNGYDSSATMYFERFWLRRCTPGGGGGGGGGSRSKKFSPKIDTPF